MTLLELRLNMSRSEVLRITNALTILVKGLYKPVSPRVKEVCIMSTQNDWLKGFSKEQGKVTAKPTVKPGKQWLTIVAVEVGVNDKGQGHIKVDFQEENGSTISQVFFEKSMRATLSKEPMYETVNGEKVKIRIDNDYNNMLTQIGEAVTPDEPFKIGRKYYANVNYGVDARGYNKPYTNIQSYVPTADDTQEDMAF